MTNATTSQTVAPTSDQCCSSNKTNLSASITSAQALPIATGFDYAVLAPAIAVELRERAERLRGLITKSTADMIVIGRDLMAIKDRLDHGQFMHWIEREIGIGIRSAQGYMAIAKLAEGKCETVALFPPSTARMLAAKLAPPEIVEQVIARAGSGDIMSDDAVKKMISKVRASARHEKREAELARRQSEGGKRAKRARAAREAQHAEWEWKRKTEHRAAAQSIIDRFSREDVRFLDKTLTWDVLAEFNRLVAEIDARS